MELRNTKNIFSLLRLHIQFYHKLHNMDYIWTHSNTDIKIIWYFTTPCVKKSEIRKNSCSEHFETDFLLSVTFKSKFTLVIKQLISNYNFRIWFIWSSKYTFMIMLWYNSFGSLKNSKNMYVSELHKKSYTYL